MLAGMGLLLTDLAEREVKVWPENWPAYRLFRSMQTQWIVGPGGATGLNYVPLFHKMDRMDLPQQEYDGLFEDVQAIEHAALEEMHSKDE